MAILNQAKLEKRVGAAELIRLTDDTGTGTVNTAVLAEAIADAEGELLGYLGQAYTVPLTLGVQATADLVTVMALDVAEYRLRMRRDHEVTDDVRKRYEAAIAWATKVGIDKTVGLLGETRLGESPASGGKIHTATGAALFGRDEMAGL